MVVTTVSLGRDLAEAEEGVIGSALVWPDATEQVARDLAPEDFHSRRWGACWGAFLELRASGVHVDVRTLADRARARGSGIVESDLISTTSAALPLRQMHVLIILRNRQARIIEASCRETLRVLAQDVMPDPSEIAAQLSDELRMAGELRASGDPESVPLSDFIAAADESAPWVIPGLMRTDWRAILVGAEGVGKGVLLRQLAMLSAQGIHPLRFRAMEPVRALLVDLENPAAAIAETGLRMDALLQRQATDYDPNRCQVWHRPGGIDLRNRLHRGELERELRALRPQLVCLGPVYKSYRKQKGEGYEDAADDAQAVLDDFRTRYNFALVLEHHAPRGASGQQRAMEPFGGQRWQAWPELGIGLVREREGTTLTLGRFRGDRLKADWPEKVTRGAVWPWEGIWPKREEEF